MLLVLLEHGLNELNLFSNTPSESIQWDLDPELIVQDSHLGWNIKCPNAINFEKEKNLIVTTPDWILTLKEGFCPFCFKGVTDTWKALLVCGGTPSACNVLRRSAQVSISGNSESLWSSLLAGTPRLVSRTVGWGGGRGLLRVGWLFVKVWSIIWFLCVHIFINGFGKVTPDSVLQS